MDPCVLIKALSQPDPYPERWAQVSVRQTHISWLFFTDGCVYKVKKPVNFGFLDFTTLEARKHFCEEEVRLNRRLAPAVYLGVVAVTAADGVIRIGGVGEPVEYAVHMRRLPEERMLPTLLAAGTVTPDTMQRLARILAEFHAQAETGCEVNQGGSLATILTNWEENFAQTLPYLDFPLDRVAYDQIRTRVSNFCRLREGLFARRTAEGRIRDGHGDLRAEHICLTEPIAIFDCIEFNRRFRHGDVASDVAFFAMDLELQGFADLSQAFVRAYIEYSGDHGLLEVLEFYKCYRAVVRAKVECFRLDDPMLTSGEKRAALQSAQRHWQLATRYAGALQRPWLLLMCGLMGTGKSTLAEALGKRVDLEHLSSDVTRKRLAGMSPTARVSVGYGEGLYRAEWTEVTYTALLQQAERFLAQGRSVLIDASFQRARHRMQARAVAQRVGAHFCLLECWCPEEEIRRRLKARAGRGGAVSDGRTDLLAQQRQAFEAPLEIPPQEHLRVDTTQDPEAAARHVVTTLGLWTRGGQAEHCSTKAQSDFVQRQE